MRSVSVQVCVCVCLCLFTYHSDSVGLGTVLQQYVDDVCVSLLGGLVKGSVSILRGRKQTSEHGVSQQHLFFDMILSMLEITEYNNNMSFISIFKRCSGLSEVQYLGLGVDTGSALKQEVDHLGVTVVTCYN